jgi:hypothetical protein
VANTYYSLKNTTVIYAENFAPYQPETIGENDILSGIGRIFSADLQSDGELNADASTSQLTEWVTEMLQSDIVQPSLLQTLVIAPMLLFQHSFPFAHSSINVTSNQNLEVTVFYGQLIGRVQIAEWTVVVFAVAAFAIYLSCIACLIWTTKLPSPPNTRFPLIDFTSRVLTKGFTDTSLATILVKASNGDKNNVRDLLRDHRVFLGDVEVVTQWEGEGTYNPYKQADQRIGFSLSPEEITPLKSEAHRIGFSLSPYEVAPLKSEIHYE